MLVGWAFVRVWAKVNIFQRSTNVIMNVRWTLFWGFVPILNYLWSIKNTWKCQCVLNYRKMLRSIKFDYVSSGQYLSDVSKRLLVSPFVVNQSWPNKWYQQYLSDVSKRLLVSLVWSRLIDNKRCEQVNGT